MNDHLKFQSPFDVVSPVGAENWRDMYAYYHVFSDENREFEESKFWFFDSMHHPEPLYPFDAIIAEAHWVGLSQYNTRVFMVPEALGIDQRIVNGYLYLSPNSISEKNVVNKRLTLFRDRAGYYYNNWDELYQKWIKKAKSTIAVLDGVTIKDLPDIEDFNVVSEGLGETTGTRLLEAFNRVTENIFVMWSYHFEMLNLGYIAYLTFMSFCRNTFPGISDQSVAKMVAGDESVLFQPDEELKKLARLAVELSVDSVLSLEKSTDVIVERLGKTKEGALWLNALDQAKEPWFNFSSGTGFYHQHRSWIDDLSVPFSMIARYSKRIRAGECINRPLDQNKRERERVVSEYRQLLAGEDDKKAFDDLLGLARKVFPYVEDHNFYVEHWHHTIFWNKVREFGAVLKRHQFLDDSEDIFLLNRAEIQGALYELVASWATGTPSRGRKYWPNKITERSKMLSKLRAYSPAPCLGQAPEEITDPFMVMLWGITSQTLREWQEPLARRSETKTIKGCAASPGVAEGCVRVVSSADQLTEVLPGEVLVCTITAPSWTPVFAYVAAAVSDIGGVMCHAAIVAREYGLPAIVGTGKGSQVLKTGQKVRVDGTTGLVTILSSSTLNPATSNQKVCGEPSVANE